MQRILNIDNIELNEDGTMFNSGTIRVEFTVSHSQDVKTEGDERATGEDVPHVANIDISGAKVEDVLHQASKPRIISLQNQLKGQFDTAQAFEKLVNGGESEISLVPEKRSRKKDPKKDLAAFAAGLDEDEKESFTQAILEDRVDAWLDEYFAS